MLDKVHKAEQRRSVVVSETRNDLKKCGDDRGVRKCYVDGEEIDIDIATIEKLCEILLVKVRHLLKLSLTCKADAELGVFVPLISFLCLFQPSLWV
ncbi:hypothetical protein H920_14465 [Fukomys damarensis]|uniref:Uncharacterized protein n=1 Tax=Fukomys damarensis TaxID=885580 RepID=A0A091CWN6_FUKDA|nr:hypothetical protein H920_14465 [Fukomys damarensis]